METAIILNTWWLKVLGEIEPKKTKNSVTKKELQETKRSLKQKGWTYEKAAKELGCNIWHLAHVLRGGRPSRSLVDRVNALPVYKGGSN